VVSHNNGITTPSTKVASSESSVALQRSKSESCLDKIRHATTQSTTTQVPDAKVKAKYAPAVIVDSSMNSMKSKGGSADKDKNGSINGTVSVSENNSSADKSLVKTNNTQISSTNGLPSLKSNGHVHKSPEKVVAVNTSPVCSSNSSSGAKKSAVMIDCKTSEINCGTNKSANVCSLTRLVSVGSTNGIRNSTTCATVSSPDSVGSFNKVQNSIAASGKRAESSHEKPIHKNAGTKKTKFDIEVDDAESHHMTSDSKTVFVCTNSAVRATTKWQVYEVPDRRHHDKTSAIVHGTTAWHVTPVDIATVSSSVSAKKSKLSLSVDESTVYNGKVVSNGSASSAARSEIIRGGSVQKQLLNEEKTNAVSALNGCNGMTASTPSSISPKEIKQGIHEMFKCNN